ncbi:MAG: hypothetical protein ACI9YT_000510 [Halobacteriales archaeon]|jgi:hypothetical protein
MPPEECGICGATVALGDAAHVMLNAKSEDGVRDYYVCPSCFEEELVPHFPDRAGDENEEDEGTEDAAGDEDAGTDSDDEEDPTGPGGDGTTSDPADREGPPDATDPTTDARD